MAMRPALYSINGLSVELGRNARAISKALADVPPDGRTGLKKVPAWRLATALKALSRHERSGRSNAGAEFDRAAAEVENVVAELNDALKMLVAVPDVQQRRLASKGIIPLVIRYADALEAATPHDLIELTAPYRAQLVGAAMVELFSLCEWQLVS